MSIILKKINGEDISPLHAILMACGKAMHEKFGLAHWYPFMDIENFRQYIQKKDLYGIYQNGIAIGTFNLSTEPRDYYYDNLWLNPDENAVYLGQLGIEPSIQGQGLGKWCMQQIEKISLQMGVQAIRFDALDSHPWLKAYYKKLGYSPCGIVKPRQWNLLCFEKILR